MHNLNFVGDFVQIRLNSDHLCRRWRRVNCDCTPAEMSCSQAEDSEMCPYIIKQHSVGTMGNETLEFSSLIGISNLSFVGNFESTRMADDGNIGRNLKCLSKPDREHRSIPNPFQ